MSYETCEFELELQLATARTWTALTFGVIIPIQWLLPSLLFLLARRLARCCRATPTPFTRRMSSGKAGRLSPPIPLWRRRGRLGCCECA